MRLTIPVLSFIVACGPGSFTNPGSGDASNGESSGGTSERGGGLSWSDGGGGTAGGVVGVGGGLAGVAGSSPGSGGTDGGTVVNPLGSGGRNTGAAGNLGGSGGNSAGSQGSGGSDAGSTDTGVAGSKEGGTQDAMTNPGTPRTWGGDHAGNFWIGPVDYAETEWHNACAPSTKYPPAIQVLYGNYLMGIANEVALSGLKASEGQLCDTCAEVEANGKKLLARIVTYGEETGPNDVDVSPELDTALNGSASRKLTWRFVSCPGSAPIQYTFDGREWTNTWFFRVWVRNARVPIAKLEYRKGSGAWSLAAWQSDGAWQAANSDFSGGFSIRLTTIDNQTLEDTLPGLNTFDPDVGVASRGNF